MLKKNNQIILDQAENRGHRNTSHYSS